MLRPGEENIVSELILTRLRDAGCWMLDVGKIKKEFLLNPVFLVSAHALKMQGTREPAKKLIWSLASSSSQPMFEPGNLIINPSDQRTAEGSNRKTVNKSYYAS